MRTVALIFLTVSALVGTVGAVSAQYGGGYFGPAHTMAVATTTMADTIGELPVWSHHRIRQIRRAGMEFSCWARPSLSAALRRPKWTVQTVSVSRRLLLRHW